MRKSFDQLRKAIEAEYPTVRAEFSDKGAHKRITLHHKGRTRFVVVAATPSCHRDFQNTMRDVRREARNLGLQ